MDANLRAKQLELQTSLGDKADIQRKLNEQIRIQAKTPTRKPCVWLR